MNDGLLHTSPTAVYIAVNAILARVIKSAYDEWFAISIFKWTNNRVSSTWLVITIQHKIHCVIQDWMLLN